MAIRWKRVARDQGSVVKSVSCCCASDAHCVEGAIIDRIPFRESEWGSGSQVQQRQLRLSISNADKIKFEVHISKDPET